MQKLELEAKVDAVEDEINFLRAVYDAVSELYFNYDEINGQCIRLIKPRSRGVKCFSLVP